MKLALRKQRDVNACVADAAPHFGLGRRGENLALEHLERAGYRIVAANFSIPIGRNTRNVTVNAEIDLVAYDGPTLCFIEVKRAHPMNSLRRKRMSTGANSAKSRAPRADIDACWG